MIKVWDLPVRLFHWVLVAAIVSLFASAKLDHLPLHAALGEAVLALLLFRILWGFVGSRTARFSDFVRGPSGVAAYLKSGKSPTPGHNPLGGWMVVTMLAGLSLQAISGLMSNDDVDFEGPLAALHVGAVLFYWLVRKDNLILPMITGRKVAD